MSVARSLAAGLALAALALGGCGDDEETSRPSTETERTEALGPPVHTVEVSETDFKLTPANPGVQNAGVIAFEVTNDGQTVHALEVEGPDGEVETGDIQPGKSKTIKADLNRPGRYEWYCPIGNHREKGMDGFVLVAGGGPSAGTETSESGTATAEIETETEAERGDDSGGAKPEDDSGKGGGEDDSGGTRPGY